MRIFDFAPPTAPTVTQQLDALRKGLGRAQQWAERGCLDEDPLLAACLRDQRHDKQAEESRGDWLWLAIQSLGAQARFRQPILKALHAPLDEQSLWQLCELAGGYAREGDNSFRHKLYEVAEAKPFADYPYLAEKEIIQLDGDRAFQLVIQARGRQLENRTWEWHDEVSIDLAKRILGSTHVESLLQESSDYWILKFASARSQASAVSTKQCGFLIHQEEMQTITVADIIQMAEAVSPSTGRMRSWGMHASESDLQVVADRLWQTTAPKSLACFLRVFSNRPLPKFDDRLLELCCHADPEVRRRAYQALSMNTHSEVRSFARIQIERGVCDRHVISLFTRNFLAGDETSIVDAIEAPKDVNELHWLLMDVLEILEKNEAADSSKLGVITYGLTPCQNCRFNAAKLLWRQHVAPAWMHEECRFDSNDDCRQLAESA